jgi:4-nitrophenyl phosphatase
MLGAVNADMRSILVLTGISDREAINNVDYQPTWVMDDIGEITAVLQDTFLSDSVENK